MRSSAESESPGDAGRAWAALAAVLGLGAVGAFAAATFAAPGFAATAAAIDWQPALAWREPWRAWSAAWLHFSSLHLAVNLVGTALVGALGWVGRVPKRAALAWFAAWPLTQFGLLARPELVHYGGLSGVLHAGVAAASLYLVVRAQGPRRAIGVALLAALSAKVLSEAPWGEALRYPADWDIAVAPVAHASGLVAGLLACAVAEMLRGRPLPSAAMIERKNHLDAIALGSLVFCCFLWGLNQVAAKSAMHEIPALWQAAARSTGGAALVWLWSRYRGIALFDRDATLRGGLLAGTLFAGEFFCIFIGLQFTTASRMVVFIYTAPFIVALGMPLIARSERLSLLQAAGLLLAFAGVAWAFSEGFSEPAAAPEQWIGDALGLLGGALWGATTLAVRASALTHASAEKTLLYQLGISSLLLLAAALLSGAPLPDHLSALAWASIGFQVVIVTFASYLLWFWLIRHYPATRLASFTMLTPLFGLLLGAVLLAEPVTGRLLFALVTVAAGIFLVNRKTA